MWNNLLSTFCSTADKRSQVQLVSNNLNSFTTFFALFKWKDQRHLYYKGRCLCVCLWTLECTNVTSPPVLKLWDSQGYLWLSYDLTEVIKLIEETFEPNFFFFKKIHSHSFRIIVIPSVLLSFPPDFCHSFRIFVIPSVLKVLDSQGYLWLSYDLTKVIKLIGERFEPKKCFFS